MVTPCSVRTAGRRQPPGVQNWGARKFARLARGIQLSHGFALVWGGLMLVVLAVFARPLAAVFNDKIAQPIRRVFPHNRDCSLLLNVKGFPALTVDLDEHGICRRCQPKNQNKNN